MALLSYLSISTCYNAQFVCILTLKTKLFKCLIRCPNIKEKSRKYTKCLFHVVLNRFQIRQRKQGSVKLYDLTDREEI